MLGVMTRPAVNRHDTLNLLYAQTGLLTGLALDYKSLVYIFGLRHWNHALINHWVILFK